MQPEERDAAYLWDMLDAIVGTVKRTPPLFCRFGLEWFYRLITNPKRIRRQIVLPVFAWKVLKEKVILTKKLVDNCQPIVLSSL